MTRFGWVSLKSSKTTVPACRCLRCGYVWVPRRATGTPTACANPTCKSPYWNRPYVRAPRKKKLADH